VARFLKDRLTFSGEADQRTQIAPTRTTFSRPRAEAHRYSKSWSSTAARKLAMVEAVLNPGRYSLVFLESSGHAYWRSSAFSRTS
jgi:hypothetical protein